VRTTAKLAVRIVFAVAKMVLRAILSWATRSSEGGGAPAAPSTPLSATPFALD